MSIFTVKMPDIGEGVVEGEVIEWLKKVGDVLTQDESVVVVMTDKATVELPAPRPGKLARQYYQPGQNAIKDKPLYDIEVAGEEAKQKPVEPISQAVVAVPVESRKPSSRVMTEGTKAVSTPPVRQLAKHLGLDINRIAGTGKEGRVTRDDVRRFVSTSGIKLDPITRLPDDEVQPLVGIRKLSAHKVAESKATIPHFTFCDSADATHLVRFRDKIRGQAEKQGIKITFTPLFIRALSLTLKVFPQFNASYDSEANSLIIHKPHNIGVAMKTDRGLIVPVIKDLQTLSFEQTMRAYASLRDKALSGKLAPGDMRDSTITLSNFGTEGGLWATPVINYPEVAILATARLYKGAVVKGDDVVAREMLNCSWSFDHRVIDGDMAAAFSNHFIKLIQNPGELL